jgi:UDP-N-acetylglucosamine 1-carboxyvinyltransferase
MVIAGVQAVDTTEVYDLQHLDRGYEHLVEKMQGIGANIQRVPDTSGRPVAEEAM